MKLKTTAILAICGVLASAAGALAIPVTKAPLSADPSTISPDGKDGKDGKELSAIEKQFDQPAPISAPASALLAFLFNEERRTADEPPVGRAFIRPGERPAVGQRVLDAATRVDEP